MRPLVPTLVAGGYNMSEGYPRLHTGSPIIREKRSSIYSALRRVL